MSEEGEEEQGAPIMVIILFMFFVLRPEEGYMQMIEYIIHSPENITSYEISTLLPLLITIPLIINRKRVNVAFNNFARAQMAKQ